MLKDKLVRLRKLKELSQYEAADRLGFSRGKLSNYEQGTRQPDYETLKHLADFYDVSLDYLLDHRSGNKENELEHFKNKIAKEFPDVDLMFKDLESFTAEEMKEVYEYIKFKKSQKK
ncbi:helix-turn-helix domain-containing protein [Oceanobacillus oncorhynchi]|uniref:helix-turn-helix domain-containing protein n=1 Tax=Oceanobacillus oncorhynchi TaxID=545501 RepID=UPI0018671D6D|nr:helix-turn-helix transcriptional regulator [Oceanobacillus oncorhynchi]